jgi:hypothetical protein
LFKETNEEAFVQARLFSVFCGLIKKDKRAGDTI